VLESLKAVHAFAQLPEAASLAAANKRIENILAKGGGLPSMPIPARFVVDAERLLFEALTAARSKYDQHVLSQDLVGALRSLAVLKEPVDHFFKDVMVNVDDIELRSNRIALLEDAHLLMNRVADLSKLAS
jgi:glycyl-tRNA synthetase beta chain